MLAGEAGLDGGHERAGGGDTRTWQAKPEGSESEERAPGRSVHELNACEVRREVREDEAGGLEVYG